MDATPAVKQFYVDFDFIKNHQRQQYSRVRSLALRTVQIPTDSRPSRRISKTLDNSSAFELRAWLKDAVVVELRRRARRTSLNGTGPAITVTVPIAHLDKLKQALQVGFESLSKTVPIADTAKVETLHAVRDSVLQQLSGSR